VYSGWVRSARSLDQWIDRRLPWLARLRDWLTPLFDRLTGYTVTDI